MPLNHASRREFLQTGAAAAAAGAFTIVAPQSVRGTQANSKISVGLIGAGNRGSADCKIVHADPRARVTALCDVFPDQFEKAKKTIGVENPEVYSDFEKLLASPNIDAVFIVTPPFEHPRMFEAAVQARKHIYLEKPIGVDVQGCKRTLAASKKADPAKNIAVGFQARYSPAYLEAYKRIQNDELGKIATARGGQILPNMWNRRPFSDPKEEHLRNWFAYRDYSGDFIVEQDCHNIDVLHWFLGDVPISAVGHCSKKIRLDYDTNDNFSVIYVWPGDVLVNFEANQLTVGGYRREGEEFSGPKGSIIMSRAKMLHYKGSDNWSRDFAKPNVEEFAVKREITIDEIENFLDRIVNNNPENAIERSVWSTCIALLGREAAYTKREVTWKGFIGEMSA